jgi:hypothetical protein
MELNIPNSNEIPPKNILEEESLKQPEESSKNLKVSDLIQKNQNKNNINNKINIDNNIIKKSEETNNEIIFHSTTKLNLDTNKIFPSKNRYPYCIVWTPIPFLTYIIPFIGQIGIANSKGIIHDFSASFFVNIDDFSFGKPTKYFQLELNEKEKLDYDKAIEKGDLKFRTLIYNFFRNNSHMYVAYILNQIKYKGKSDFNMIYIWWILIWKGKYVSFLAFIKTYIGFFIFLFIIAIAIR